MYSVVLYSLFILFWIAIIFDFVNRPKDRDDDPFTEFKPLRKLARVFWVFWIVIVLFYTLIASIN